MNKQHLMWAIGGVFGLLVVAFFLTRSTLEPTSKDVSTLSNRELALLCDKEMGEGFHIHPNLEIVINSEQVLVPANIGVTATCMTVLHTHTSNGVIHVESPEKRDFTLGDFFAVWGKPFNQEELFEYQADATHAITIRVNGEIVDTYENTILKDGDKIFISYESTTGPIHESGIEGTVFLGPQCPVEMNPPDPSCADKPYETSLALTSFDGARVIKTFSSDSKGAFTVSVPEGQYNIRSTAAANVLPYCSSNGVVKVSAGAYTNANVSCDTGIR